MASNTTEFISPEELTKVINYSTTVVCVRKYNGERASSFGGMKCTWIEVHGRTG